MPRDLPANILASYLKTGKSPRVFVSIPDAGLYLSTAAGTVDGDTYGGLIKSGGVGTIRWTVDPWGGMGEVGGVTVRNLEIGEDFPLGTHAAVLPLQSGGYPGAARLLKISAGGAYADARNATSGSFGTIALAVGRQYSVTDPDVDTWMLARSALQFSIPAALTSCESFALALEGLGSHADTLVELYVVSGNWTSWGIGSNYNDFAGWAAGPGAYTGTILNETWNSDMMDLTEGSLGNVIRFNAAGRKAVEDAAGGTLKLMIIAKRDYLYAAPPTGDEYLLFRRETAQAEIVYNTKPLTNRQATVYLAYDPAPASAADMLRLWTGLIDSYSISRALLTLSLKQSDHKWNFKVPELITEDEFADCPDDTIGKAIPLVVGNWYDLNAAVHKTGVPAYTAEGPDGTAGETYGYQDYIKCPVVRETYKIKILASRPAMKSIHAPVFVWNSSLDAFEQCYAKAEDAAFTDATVLMLSTATAGIGMQLQCASLYWKVTGVVPHTHTLSTGSVENPEYSYDDDPATGMEVLADGTEVIYQWNDQDGVTLTMSAELVTDIPKILFAWYQDEDLPVTTTGEVTFLNDSGSWVKPSQSESITNKYHIIYIKISTLVAYGISTLSLDRFKLTLTLEDGMVIKNVMCLFGSISTDQNEYGLTGEGAAFESWIDETGITLPDGTSYDRTNDYDAGDLIENPALAIEFVAREFGKLTTAEIDVEAFDTAAADLADWTFAFELLDRTGWRDYIGKLAEQCKARVYEDEYGRLTVNVFAADAAFPNAGANTGDTPGELDIVEELAEPTAGVYARHPLLEGIEFEAVDLDEVANDFVVHYRKNMFSGEYQEAVYITHGEGDPDAVETNVDSGDLEGGRLVTGTGGLAEMCADCYTALDTAATMEVEADAIRDKATASKLLQHLVERHTTKGPNRRLVVKYTGKSTLLGVELTDYVNIRQARLGDDNLYGDNEMNARKWLVKTVEYDLDSHRITHEAIEV